MTRRTSILLLSLALLTLTSLTAEEAKPINALMVTGGCCHNYNSQKQILSEGISTVADVKWTVVHQGGSTTNTRIPLYEKEDWWKGYDVVLHNECFAAVSDPAWTKRIITPHFEGLPAVVVHCAMHCYRDKTDEWFKFVGVTSHRHGRHYPFEVINLEAANPIMKEFGEKWMTPKGELYLISKIWPGVKPLAHAMSKDTKKYEVCAWTHTYGKGRVFGTTIGHHAETMATPTYINMVTRGLLWAAGRLGEKTDLKKVTEPIKYTPTKKQKKKKTATVKPPSNMVIVKGKKMVPANIARGKKATATYFEDPPRNPNKALDGNYSTRFSPANSKAGFWWQVYLTKPEDLTGCRIVWEFNGKRYRYKIEGSDDGKIWSMLVDFTKNEKVRTQVHVHKFEASGIRYLKMTITGLDQGAWGSFWEFEVFGKELEEWKPTSQLHPEKRKGAGYDPESWKRVKAPDGFKVSLFAGPPMVNYPTCIAAAPTGEVFVGIDKNGSLDRGKNRGSIVRCIDKDGDGAADEITKFVPDVDSPRGLFYDNGTLWCLHPPDITAYYDRDGDGVAEESEVIVKGIAFDFTKRPADHTSNGLRMGIDGWLYMAIGDFGFHGAVAKDGTKLQLRGGGIVRVRPDGSELELYAHGTRNTYDVAVDPFLNLFTRDNNNDGGGWGVRFSHIMQMAEYGYPSLFKNFQDEIMHPLADYGGGSGTGAMYLHEPGFAGPYGNALFTCDWGRNKIYYHPLEPAGATFKATQETFVTISRPTDMDVDGRSRLYLTSWRGGQYRYKGEDVGYVVRLISPDKKQPEFPDLKKATDAELLKHLESPSYVCRLYTQREILRRKPTDQIVRGLEVLATGGAPLYSKVAGLFTLKQLLKTKSHEALLRIAEEDDVREFALRALADRKSEIEGVPAKPFIKALSDSNPRVQVAALVGLARLGNKDAGEKMLSLTVPQKKEEAKMADPKPKPRRNRKGFKSGVVNTSTPGHAIDIDVDISGAKTLFLVVTDGGNGSACDHGDWVAPRLIGLKGEKKLTDLRWKSAQAGWGKVYVNRNCTGKPMRVNGQPVAWGIGTHAHSTIVYDLPAGYSRFKARGGLDNSGTDQAPLASVQFMVFTDQLPKLFGSPPGPASGKSSEYEQLDVPHIAFKAFGLASPAAWLRHEHLAVPHIALKSLVSLGAVEPCLKVLDVPASPLVPGALRALSYLHVPEAVEGLRKCLSQTEDAAHRRKILRTLMRLYHREADWNGRSWGTRPDTSGPYYQPAKWAGTEQIEKLLMDELAKADADSLKQSFAELSRHKVQLKNVTRLLLSLAEKGDEMKVEAVSMLFSQKSISVEALPLFTGIALSPKADPKLRAKAFLGLEKFGGDQSREGALKALVAFAKISNPHPDLIRSRQQFLRNRKRSSSAAHFLKLAQSEDDGFKQIAYSVLLNIANDRRIRGKIKTDAMMAIDSAWEKPGTSIVLLQSIAEMKFKNYQKQIKERLAHVDPMVQEAAAATARALGIKQTAKPAVKKGPVIGGMKYGEVLAKVSELKGDPVLGKQLFVKQNCLTCHTTAKGQELKGPFLGGISTRYGRRELIESLLRPNAVIAQGFTTYWFKDEDELTYTGFIVRESGTEVEIRDVNGAATILKTDKIEKRGTLKTSVMPEGLLKDISVKEFAALLSYLEELKEE